MNMLNGLSEEEQQVIDKDRQENPNCFYSTSLSTSCRTINGESKCEMLRKIFRQCPGKPKELLLNHKQVTEDEHEAGDGSSSSSIEFFNREGMDSSMDSFGAFDPFRRRGEDDFEAQMNPFDFVRKEFLRPFEGFFGGFFENGGDLFSGLEEELERRQRGEVGGREDHGEDDNSGFGSFRIFRPRRSAPPPEPPHYSYTPPQDKTDSSKKNAPKHNQPDVFEGYTGRVDEI